MRNKDKCFKDRQVKSNFSVNIETIRRYTNLVMKRNNDGLSFQLFLEFHVKFSQALVLNLVFELRY